MFTSTCCVFLCTGLENELILLIQLFAELCASTWLTDYQSADTTHSIYSADRWPFHTSTCAIIPNSLLFYKQTSRNCLIPSSVCAVSWKPRAQIHGCLKNLYWKWFWCCTPLQTLSAFCKSPSNSKQRQDPSQVSCGAASPACLWTWLGNSWVGTTRICLSFTPAPSLPSPKMFPETAQSSSVLSHQHPSRIIKHSRGSHRNKFWTFLFWFSGLFVCGFSFLRESPCVNPACIVSFLSVVSASLLNLSTCVPGLWNKHNKQCL